MVCAITSDGRTKLLMIIGAAPSVGVTKANRAKDENATPDTMKSVTVRTRFFLRYSFATGRASTLENQPDGRGVTESISDAIRLISAPEKANRQPARRAARQM